MNFSAFTTTGARLIKDNTSDPIMSIKEDIQMPFLSLVVYTFAYGAIFLMAVIGNILVVYVVVSMRYMRTTVNCFIMNLAIADLMGSIFCLFPTLISHIFNGWRLGALMCKLVPYMQGVSVSASVNTLAAISIDRFLTIFLEWPLDRQRALWLIGIIWIMAITIILPWLLFYELKPDPTSYVRASDGQLEIIQYCRSYFPDGHNGSRTYFTSVIFITCYIIPLLIISASYFLILYRIWTRYSPGLVTAEAIQRSRTKVLKMLLTVTVIFGISWLPLYVVLHVLYYAEISIEATISLQKALPTIQWIALSNSAVNPVIYCYYSKRYRASFSAALRMHCVCNPLLYCRSLSRNYSLHAYLRRVDIRTASDSSSARRKALVTRLNQLNNGTHSPQFLSPVMPFRNEHRVLTHYNGAISENSLFCKRKRTDLPIVRSAPVFYSRSRISEKHPSCLLSVTPPAEASIEEKICSSHL